MSTDKPSDGFKVGSSRVTRHNGMLLVEGVQVGEYNPTRWRCMVVGCQEYGRWYASVDPALMLSDHYLDTHWTDGLKWADMQIEP